MILQRFISKPEANSDVNAEQGEDADTEQLGVGVAVPFGPMLALGGWLYFVWLAPYFDAYFEPFAELFSQ